MENIDYAPELGKRFVTVLEEWLTPEEFETVRTRNDANEPGVCHSHDFCDANMAMDQAFVDVLNRHPRVLEDPSESTDESYTTSERKHEADNVLWGRAWDWAIKYYLSHSPEALSLEARGYPEAPAVRADDRASLIRWLVWNDPNGSYTDIDAALEGRAPHSLETLISLAREQGAAL